MAKSIKPLPVNQMHQIIIELSNGRNATLITSDLEMAQREYEQIRAQGRYSGYWIQSIRLESDSAS